MQQSSKKQSGAVLLLMMLVLITGTSWVLLDVFKEVTKVGLSHNAKTDDALQRAKSALIGYALIYPDRPTVTDTSAGPGYLPCPDDNDDGTALGGCNSIAASSVEIGRLPWSTLGTGRLTDSNGDTLWYAVSLSHRNSPAKTQPMNSDTVGSMSVDDSNDIVAVIFSPGSALDFQNRPSNNAIDYLEDDNSDTDESFVTASTLTQLPDESESDYEARLKNSFNDVVMFITRAELMQAVEKRVLAETRNILNRYYTNYRSYPWLSPFSNNQYDNLENIIEGRLPVHPDNSDFTTEIYVTWNFANATIVKIPDNGFFDDSDITGSPFILTFPATCRWTGLMNEIACKGQIITGIRDYTIDFGYSDIGDGFIGTTNLTTPVGSINADGFREHFINVNSNFPNYEAAVGESGEDIFNIEIEEAGNTITLALNENSTGALLVTGLNHKLSYTPFNVINVSSGLTEEIIDLPEWYIKNEWYKYILVSETQYVDPQGGTVDCNINVVNDCLSVVGVQAADISDNGIQVTIVSAGGELATQNRDDEQLSDYFENENTSSGDQTYQQMTYPNPGGMNDQVIRITNSAVSDL